MTWELEDDGVTERETDGRERPGRVGSGRARIGYQESLIDFGSIRDGLDDLHAVRRVR